MSNTHLPDLTFPMVCLGENETPWDMAPLLYEGGASCRINLVAKKIACDVLGRPLMERLSLIQALHDEIVASLVGGNSKHTARRQLECLRYLVTWAELAGKPITLDEIATTYVHWTDSLLQRVRVAKSMQYETAYRQACITGVLIDRILERASPILSSTSLRYHRRARTLSTAADKQNLENTFSFGYLLADICDALTESAVFGQLPIRIPIRGKGELLEWNGLTPRSEAPEPKTRHQRYQAKLTAKVLSPLDVHDIEKRSTVINTRVEAELLMFIGQTGMNTIQAQTLTMRQFSYKSTIDGYQVRDYKHRRQGEVLFEIFSEYKTVFERYLLWRKAVFPEGFSSLLFPFSGMRGRAVDERYKFWRTRAVCKKLEMRFIPPTTLRKTRVNWLLRRSRDLDLTADMAQHSKEVLVRNYEQPSLQVALSEVTRFWNEADPALPSPATGLCNGVPKPVEEVSGKALQPDCLRPAGCLWCEHHRDIDSFDYVWSLSCMRYLKTIALSGFITSRKNTVGPVRHVELTIERISAKLRWFQKSNKVRSEWVEESLTRIDEGDYHPHWGYLIASIEGA